LHICRAHVGFSGVRAVASGDGDFGDGGFGDGGFGDGGFGDGGS
jgi:hypothetical protein